VFAQINNFYFKTANGRALVDFGSLRDPANAANWMWMCSSNSKVQVDVGFTMITLASQATVAWTAEAAPSSSASPQRRVALPPAVCLLVVRPRRAA
jgi:hypothetical protein